MGSISLVIKMDWFVRLNLMREKSIISEYENNISGIVIDAHILETFPNASANFLGRQRLPFVIDPVTFKFSIYNSIDLFSKKGWYPSLLDHFFGDIIEDSLDEGYGPISPDLLNGGNLKKYVGRVMYYQRHGVNSLLEGLEIFEEFPNVFPSILIPPYSIITSRKDKWFDANIACIEEAISIKKSDEVIYAVIPVYKDLLHHGDFIDSVISRYNIEGVTGYFVWITDFNEEREDEQSLLNYADFFRKLQDNGKIVINFYGGYLSMIFSTLGMMDGITSGLGYGEHRNPFAGGGPVPYAYYFRPFHVQIPRDDATPLYKLSGISKCDCEYCQKYDDLENIELNESLYHLAHERIREMEDLDSKNPEDIIEDIDRTLKLMEKVDPYRIYSPYYVHLGRWKAVLEKIQNNTR